MSKQNFRIVSSYFKIFDQNTQTKIKTKQSVIDTTYKLLIHSRNPVSSSRIQFQFPVLGQHPQAYYESQWMRT